MIFICDFIHNWKINHCYSFPLSLPSERGSTLWPFQSLFSIAKAIVLGYNRTLASSRSSAFFPCSSLLQLNDIHGLKTNKQLQPKAESHRKFIFSQNKTKWPKRKSNKLWKINPNQVQKKQVCVSPWMLVRWQARAFALYINSFVVKKGILKHLFFRRGKLSKRTKARRISDLLECLEWIPPQQKPPVQFWNAFFLAWHLRLLFQIILVELAVPFKKLQNSRR